MIVFNTEVSYVFYICMIIFSQPMQWHTARGNGSHIA